MSFGETRNEQIALANLGRIADALEAIREELHRLTVRQGIDDSDTADFVAEMRAEMEADQAVRSAKSHRPG